MIKQLCPPLDQQLTSLLLDEFISQERRYVLCDWEPATLDGGQYAEIASRLIYHIDSGTLNMRKGVDPCLKYIEDSNNSNSHNFAPRRTALHLCRVLRTIYKFRSQRGAVHIDPDYSANELDAGLVIANVRWVMAELLRVFWTGDQSEVSRVIREIIRYEVPAVLSFDGRHVVLRTDCSAEEEILILLHNSGEAGMSRGELGESVAKAAPTITNTLIKLIGPKCKQVIKDRSNRYFITPLGTKRIHDELAGKLVTGG